MKVILFVCEATCNKSRLFSNLSSREFNFINVGGTPFQQNLTIVGNVRFEGEFELRFYIVGGPEARSFRLHFCRMLCQIWICLRKFLSWDAEIQRKRKFFLTRFCGMNQALNTAQMMFPEVITKLKPTVSGQILFVHLDFFTMQEHCEHRI